MRDWGRRVVLALMLPLAGIAGNVGPYLVALVCIVLTLAELGTPRRFAGWREPLPAMFLVAFATLGACFIATAEAPGDAVFTFNFVMLLLAGPLFVAMTAGAGSSAVRIVAWLALTGAALALLATGFGLLMGVPRGAWPTLGVIRMSNTALILGFLALAGMFVEGGRERWWLLLGPVLGVAVVFLTSSRGPLLALALLAPVATIFALVRLPRRLLPAALAGIAVALVAGLVLLATHERLADVPALIGRVLSGESGGVDRTTHIRLVLYRAGLEAFAQSPWIGHGWDELMTAIRPFLDADGLGYADWLPQLHNDALNFAVAAGIVGILVYLLLLAAPIIAALRAPRDSQWFARLYGATVLVSAYVGAGLTDLMFGFEFHTALYVTLAVILIGYCRDQPQIAGGDGGHGLSH